MRSWTTARWRYRDRQDFLTHLGEVSGTEFDPADHVLHFVNGEDDDLIVWRIPAHRGP
ncbi:hypothetical protein OG730_19835 [Streptomyces sp. NBC_01298]|uniref:hypothetical protein n=1 Tax=Streptomyces sp. NBC_01298 TaxID=2903817 RepID=UPI002E14665D|nr:hypothetical protein OG730_19835 [Streptomyces sp. NBC_01298]